MSSRARHAARAAALVATLLAGGALVACHRDGSCLADVCTAGTVQRVGAGDAATPVSWAVRGDDGTTYAVVPALPALFQRDGMRVKLVAKKHEGHVVGAAHPVELVKLETF